MNSFKKGFTLIELLVVISILSVLASIVLVATNNLRMVSRDSIRTSNIGNLQTALELYYDDHGQYPEISPSTALAVQNEDGSQAATEAAKVLTWNDLMTALNNGKYLSKAEEINGTPYASTATRVLALFDPFHKALAAGVTMQDPLYPARSYGYMSSSETTPANQNYRLQVELEDKSNPILKNGLIGEFLWNDSSGNPSDGDYDTYGQYPWANCDPARGVYCIGPKRDSFAAYIPGKPVVYLYPTHTMEVSVRISPESVDVSVPAYEKGWDVIAHPDGAILNPSDGATYPYLYWEGHSGKPTVDRSTGFVVAISDIRPFLAKALSEQGLNAGEAQEFIEYWAPRMVTAAPYVYVYFMPKADYDKLVPMTITPKPDTVIRVYMLFKALSAPISVTPERLSAPARKGFTVVEWGGDRAQLR